MPEIKMHGKVNMKEVNVLWEECMINETLPNVYFLEKKGIDHNSKPVEWVDIFIPWKKDNNNEGLLDIETIADHTNMRITCITASHRRRKPIKPFSIDEVIRYFGLYMLNGLNSSPQIIRKFNSRLEDPVQGNNMCHNAFGPNAAEQHVYFKGFLTLVNLKNPSPTSKADPIY